ncbi:hypothetical protein, partial [Streptomyces massasporeus]|uniref:Acb2/Tad1 domain-containing protein n=1 Tax=Streptomyces massasporeus TaxID=67324 RepID=UPI003703B3DA
MSDQKHHGLPVAGYRPQTDEALALVNANKDAEERVLRILDSLATRPDIAVRPTASQRLSMSG